MRSSVDCSICGAGTYQSGKGMQSQSDCSYCIPGTYQTGIGMSEISDCRKCLDGKYQSGIGMIDVNSCKLCEAGTYQTGTGGSFCPACLSGSYSLEVGSNKTTSCIPWTICKLFEEVEDDLSPPWYNRDRKCLKYQYEAPVSAKYFIFFGLALSVFGSCLIFLRKAPDHVLSGAKGQSRFVLRKVKDADSWRALYSELRNSLIFYPPSTSLKAALFTFWIGIHNVLSDISLLCLLSTEAPGFFFKKIRGELFYLTLIAVSGSVLADAALSYSVGEIQYLWLYISSCTEQLPTCRGKNINFTNKMLRLIVQTLPLALVQSVFLYQTYMKYQTSDNSGGSKSQNPHWWLDYGILFQSATVSILGIIKQIVGFRLMLKMTYSLSSWSKKAREEKRKEGEGCEERVYDYLRLISGISNDVQILEHEHLNEKSKAFLQWLNQYLTPQMAAYAPTVPLRFPVCRKIRLHAASSAVDFEICPDLDRRIEVDCNPNPSAQDFYSEVADKAGMSSGDTNEYAGHATTLLYLLDQDGTGKFCFREYYYCSGSDDWLANERGNLLVPEAVTGQHAEMLKLSLWTVFENHQRNQASSKAKVDDPNPGVFDIADGESIDTVTALPIVADVMPPSPALSQPSASSPFHPQLPSSSVKPAPVDLTIPKAPPLQRRV